MNRKMNNVWIRWCTIGIIYALFVPNPTSALMVQPLKSDIIVDAGVEKKTEINIINNSEFVEFMSFHVRAFFAGEKQGVPEFNEEGEHLQWFHLPQEAITIQPHESKKIDIGILAPPTTEPGGYYAAVFARAINSEQGNSVSYANEVGVLFFITVAGDVVHDLVWNEFDLIADSWGKTRVIFNYSLFNNGTVHETPQGTIFIENIITKKKIMVEVNEEQLRILPHSKRDYLYEWKPADKWFSGINPFRWGMYRATMSIENSNQESKSKNFIVWSPVGLAIVSMLAVMSAYGRVRRKKFR